MDLTIEEIKFITPDAYAIEITPGEDLLLATPEDDSFLGWKHLPQEAQDELNTICKTWQEQLDRCVALIRLHKDTTPRDVEGLPNVDW